MSQVAIRVEGLGKRYRLGQQVGYKTLRETLLVAYHTPTRVIGQRLLHMRHPPSATSHELSATSHEPNHIWALKDISFEVKRGEAIGIIGRNGSGKSTLLKVLSRITAPTEGRVEIHGRVGSLLEVGTGFHPELTGRENIYLNAAIIGMKRAEVSRKFDDIVAFAEIERFLDTPVKRYSSGMYVRLAFAVAAHLEPEILIVDEVLAVGDAQFQKKCLGKMGDVTKSGRTVLFVSHNMLAVQNLCTRAILLQEGRVAQNDLTERVVSNYLDAGAPQETERVWNLMSTAPGNDKVRLHAARVRPEKGSVSDPITVQTPFVMEFEYWNLQAGAHLNLSLHLYNDQGVHVFNTAPMYEPVWHGRPFPAGLLFSTCLVPGNLMNDGTHRIDLLVVQDQAYIVYSYGDILNFAVQEAAETRVGAWLGKWAGTVRPLLNWTTELVEPGQAL